MNENNRPLHVEHAITAAEILRSPVIVILLNIIVAGIMTFINFAFITGRYSEKFSHMESDLTDVKGQMKVFNEQGSSAVRTQIELNRERFSQVLARLTLIEPLALRVPSVEHDLSRIDNEVKDLRNAKVKP